MALVPPPWHLPAEGAGERCVTAIPDPAPFVRDAGAWDATRRPTGTDALREVDAKPQRARRGSTPVSDARDIRKGRR